MSACIKIDWNIWNPTIKMLNSCSRIFRKLLDCQKNSDFWKFLNISGFSIICWNLLNLWNLLGFFYIFELLYFLIIKILWKNFRRARKRRKEASARSWVPGTNQCNWRPIKPVSKCNGPPSVIVFTDAPLHKSESEL